VREKTLRQEMVVHIIHYGRTFCPISYTHGTPNKWPDGHVFVTVLDAKDSNCGECVSAYEESKKGRL